MVEILRMRCEQCERDENIVRKLARPLLGLLIDARFISQSCPVVRRSPRSMAKREHHPDNARLFSQVILLDADFIRACIPC